MTTRPAGTQAQNQVETPLANSVLEAITSALEWHAERLTALEEPPVAQCPKVVFSPEAEESVTAEDDARLLRENAHLTKSLSCSQDRSAELYREVTRLKQCLDRQGEMLTVYKIRSDKAETKLKEAEFARDENVKGLETARSLLERGQKDGLHYGATFAVADIDKMCARLSNSLMHNIRVCQVNCQQCGRRIQGRSEAELLHALSEHIREHDSERTKRSGVVL